MGSPLCNKARAELVRAIKDRFAKGGSAAKESLTLWWPWLAADLRKLCEERPRLEAFRVAAQPVAGGGVQLGAFRMGPGWAGYECLEGPLYEICEDFGFKLDEFLATRLSADCVCTPLTPCLAHDLRTRVLEANG